jgi:ATP-binding cassette subfamily B multidrug efflux pump
MGWMLSILQRGRAAMSRLDHIFDAQPSICDPPDAASPAAIKGRIEFRNVDFAYRTAGNGHQVLAGVSFRIEPGQKLALVGRTGAGKSTVAMLLPRLFDVSGGQILLDGRDIRTLPLAQLRRSIGFVPQDSFLFSTTVRANISFGLDQADEAAAPAAQVPTAQVPTAHVRRAAAIAGVAPDIESFPRGYDTVVGERGITLSGGQKQRLALARAIITDPRILILDDALSSVDIRTERAILRALEDVMRNRTSIVIAHRVSTIQDADVIAVVDDGRVVELGDHASLLAHDGLYADLFRQQRLEEEIADL